MVLILAQVLFKNRWWALGPEKTTIPNHHMIVHFILLCGSYQQVPEGTGLVGFGWSGKRPTFRIATDDVLAITTDAAKYTLAMTSED